MTTWGLIGASSIAAEQMIGAFRSNGGTIKSVLSSDSARAQSYADTHGIAKGVTSLDEMLADPDLDAVYISTTNEKHFAQAMAAIAAGKHVLCEKPLATNIDDAVTMVQAAKDAGLVFATNHHLRNAGSHIAIRDAIKAGKIGRVLSVRVHHAVLLPKHLQGWRLTSPEAGGGVIADIVVHDADTVGFQLGEYPVDVVAMSAESGLGQGVEDSCMSIWHMPSGVMVQTHESFTHEYAKTAFEVYGTEGAILARNVMTPAPMGEIEIVTASGRAALPFSGHGLYDHAVKLFEGALAGKGRPGADGVDGIKSLAVAAAVAQAAKSGQRTAVDFKGL
ncbi:Gfo/Idh/MocA family protein [Puniceibacterium sediminis]|uniref:1,5-anhydro-D-fructose reductase (1,5-anhydro-D-mannitol-forming) n=1 Tax=Puniceibacterium sediminis TaxID=1608407 RepID=A0A238XNB4_9RHOB|nr:Gfo/Idh/MocA family oxidoreductase [Puniceibacterium sediminis]SNR60190.1 1,5-anhydro-D-fructose reductase (1,5-anhydro-D-mannitol-forming) [Puniceibacterium sediminis]